VSQKLSIQFVLKKKTKKFVTDTLGRDSISYSFSN